MHAYRLQNLSWKQLRRLPNTPFLRPFARRSHLHQNAKSVLGLRFIPLNTHPTVKIDTSDGSRTMDINPIGWFEDRVASGTATISDATTCLKFVLSRIPKPRPEREKAMRNSAAGSKVIEWLPGSGPENIKEFFQTPSIKFLLARFLTAEGRQILLWNWIQSRNDNLITQTGLERIQILDGKAALLASLITAEYQQRGGDAAVEVLQTATHIEGTTEWERRFILYPSATFIIQHMTDRKSPFSPKSFDALSRSAHYWTYGLDPSNLAVERALLAAHHPLHPNADPGLALIRNRVLDMLDEKDRARRPLNLHTQKPLRLIRLTQGIVQVLMSQGRYDEAIEVLKFARTRFPKERILKDKNGTID